MYRIVAIIPERELGIVGDFLVWKKFLEERAVAHQADRVEFEGCSCCAVVFCTCAPRRRIARTQPRWGILRPTESIPQ